jgi:hypothetical protein
VQAEFSTTFTTPATVIPITPVLSTGVSTVTVSGSEFPSEGAPIDFATGDLVLDGQGVILNAPGLNTAISTGLRVACRLSPVPDRTRLAAAPAVRAAAGKSRVGKPLKGDTITKMTATFVPGAVAPDPAVSDLYVGIRAPDGSTIVLLHVGAGLLTARGKRLSIADTDGTNIVVVTGQKKVGEELAAVSGKIALRQTARGLTLTLSESGLDLSKLESGTGSVVVGLATTAASRPVRIRKTAKGVSFR